MERIVLNIVPFFTVWSDNSMRRSSSVFRETTCRELERETGQRETRERETRESDWI